MPLERGTTLGLYEIQASLGTGGWDDGASDEGGMAAGVMAPAVRPTLMTPCLVVLFSLKFPQLSACKAFV